MWIFGWTVDVSQNWWSLIGRRWNVAKQLVNRRLSRTEALPHADCIDSFCSTRNYHARAPSVPADFGIRLISSLKISKDLSVSVLKTVGLEIDRHNNLLYILLTNNDFIPKHLRKIIQFLPFVKPTDPRCRSRIFSKNARAKCCSLSTRTGKTGPSWALGVEVVRRRSILDS